MFKTDRLRGRIIEKFGKYINFAKASNHSPAFISDVLNGKAYLKQKDIKIWADLLDISANELNDYFFTTIVHETEQ